MILIGLTGGAASGKSTVAKLLLLKGAEVIDADRLGHEAYKQGTAVYDAVISRFGPEIVKDDRTIDRPKLGEIVFADSSARRDLETIVHPAIYEEITKRIDSARSSDKVVVVDAALLVETGRGRLLGLDALVVVAADVDEQIRRMIDDRGMSPDSARARIGAQAPGAQKLAAADYVIDNRTSMNDLEASVETLWQELHERFGSKAQGEH